VGSKIREHKGFLGCVSDKLSLRIRRTFSHYEKGLLSACFSKKCGSSSGLKLFAKVISGLQSSLLAGKESNLFQNEIL